MISLTTDFDDFYSGQMKGQIYKINPDAKIIDITHKINRHSIYDAAYVISTSYSYFPKGTIHVVVVDPGVGSQRAPLVIKYDEHIFVGPDNGIFSLFKGDIFKIDLEKLKSKLSKYGIKSTSKTFHGRDIFAPAAALLDIGEMDFLEKTSIISTLPYKKEITKNSAILSVLYIDSFGNIILNLKKDDIEIGDIELSNIKIPVLTHYEEGRNLDLISLYSSSGHLEISKYLGNANSCFNLKSGDIVKLILKN
ncbi:MAG: Chlorinase [Candidatus Methanofastidiosum methylothiophilum]|uniref:Chlorinase n=1 Tax=Candidatus Methanofastidiosum methylothiophilum TaxID=1705564 RepID=A0A150IQJ4_9EURY|nr:MAG: Chlorinase [Candidatus Methanofastidiosum methylthiophilus]KYC47257.1 MAG: Chlorinase [Candidatus Methanofastidiosum methylthiophilus]KYC50351.1 MAG: Chlorinase [Candidatus Methanofastidiosum methylthiophilus]